MTLHRKKYGKSKMMKAISSKVIKMNDVKFGGELNFRDRSLRIISTVLERLN